MLIRRERRDDVERIDDVHRLAFADAAPAGSEPVEVGLVRALRSDAGWVPALSLVAETGDGQVIGHVVGSEGSLDDTPVIGLARSASSPSTKAATSVTRSCTPS